MKSTADLLLRDDATIKVALEALNGTGRYLTIFLIDGSGRLKGSVTDGDIRRGLLSGATLDSAVSLVMNTAPRTLRDGEPAIDLFTELRAHGIKVLPVIDAQGHVVRIADLDRQRSVLPVQALIMAGGRGVRLRPYTDDLPKPLLPVGGRPIIEHALELLGRYGISDVSVSVNYLREKIIEHLGNGERYGLKIAYVHEDQPMGTAGALGRIGHGVHDTVLMMNSDLLTDVALDRMYKRFMETGADLAVATTDHMVDLPYAVMDLEGDRVKAFKEKPSVAYPCNAGIYLMKRSVLDLVPKDTPYNATDLIQDLLDRDAMVVAHRIQGEWLDIGKHEDLKRARRNTAEHPPGDPT
ncbi:MAG: nucleotidyltransferase family protein [Flavobacteriales bacterium]|nr:nucleotidyltransferase family protein [Flavobacteriales bacterium]